MEQFEQLVVKCTDLAGGALPCTMEDGHPSSSPHGFHTSPDGFHSFPDGHLRSPEEVSADLTTQLTSSRVYPAEDYDSIDGEEFKVRYLFDSLVCDPFPQKGL